MQNTQTSPRTQRTLKHLEERWEALQPPSSDVFKRVLVLLTDLQAPQEDAAALKKVAEYIVSTMNLHLFNMLAIFRENAELEGISVQVREKTLADVLPEIISLTDEINKRLSIQSLDDLAALVNITVALELLSESDTADDAQNWLYEVPVLYHGRLQQEQLLADAPAAVKQYQVVHCIQRSVSWLSSHTHKGSKHSATSKAHTVPTATSVPSPTYIRAPLKPDNTPIATRA
jgi:hypothetical protein